MASILRKRITHWNGCEYTLELSLPDDAIDPNARSATFQVSAEKYCPDDETVAKVDVVIILEHRQPPEYDTPSLVAILICEDFSDEWTLYEGLQSGDEPSDDEPTKVGVERDDELIGSSIEEFLQAIPAGDPVLGCVLKAGISAIAGQLIRCNNNWVDGRRDESIQMGRLQMIVGCLKESRAKLLKKGVFRTLRCWVTLGLG